VSTYPCVALLAFSGQRTKLVALVQGRVRAPELLAALRRAVNEQGMLLMAEQLEQEERVSGVALLSNKLLHVLFEVHVPLGPGVWGDSGCTELETTSIFTCHMQSNCIHLLFFPAFIPIL
jgi:hypothetical protein